MMQVLDLFSLVFLRQLDVRNKCASQYLHIYMSKEDFKSYV